MAGAAVAAAPAPPPANPGFFADLKQKFREGKIKTYARWLGVLNVFLTVGFTLAMFSLMIPSGLICIIVGVLVGIIELPFCCTFLPLCQKISSYMTFFEVYMIRGVLYIGLGVLFILLFFSMGGILNLLYGPLFIVNGLMYMLAHCRGTCRLFANDTTNRNLIPSRARRNAQQGGQQRFQPGREHERPQGQGGGGGHGRGLTRPACGVPIRRRHGSAECV